MNYIKGINVAPTDTQTTATELNIDAIMAKSGTYLEVILWGDDISDVTNPPTDLSGSPADSPSVRLIIQNDVVYPLRVRWVLDDGYLGGTSAGGITGLISGVMAT